MRVELCVSPKTPAYAMAPMAAKTATRTKVERQPKKWSSAPPSSFTGSTFPALTRKVATSEGDGTVFRVVSFGPGVAPRQERVQRGHQIAPDGAAQAAGIEQDGVVSAADGSKARKVLISRHQMKSANSLDDEYDL